MNPLEYGQALRAYREKLKQSQRDVVQGLKQSEIKMSQSTLSLAERGIYTESTMETLLSYYEVSLQELEDWYNKYQEFMSA